MRYESPHTQSTLWSIGPFIGPFIGPYSSIHCLLTPLTPPLPPSRAPTPRRWPCGTGKSRHPARGIRWQGEEFIRDFFLYHMIQYPVHNRHSCFLFIRPKISFIRPTNKHYPGPTEVHTRCLHTVHAVVGERERGLKQMSEDGGGGGGGSTITAG